MSLTYDEILATPDSLKKTGEYVKDRASEYKKMAEARERILFIGCGSSFCLAESAAQTTVMRLGRPAFALAAGDVLVHLAAYAPMFDKALVVAISRSGSTSEVVYALTQMRKLADFDLVSVCCVEGSPLSKMAGLALDMPWAFDASVCQTRCVTCLYYACALLTASAAGDAKLLASLFASADLLAGFLERNEGEFRRIAEFPWTDAVILGDAEIAGLCREGALAYREICQLPGEFYHILDSRHGPMVLFGKNTLVVIALGDGYEFEIDFVKEVVARGCHVVIVSDASVSVEGAVNVVTGVAGCHAARGIPFIVVNQLVSFFKSSATGADPDHPNGLDPWIKL